MSESRWSREALQARLAVVEALNAHPEASAARAVLRLELVDIIAAVDAGRINADEAALQLEQLQASAVSAI